jgi:hypothetical protein
MSPLRLTVACLLFALSFDACSCTKPPVSQTLKPEGEACTDDEQCESSLCDKLPGQSQVCFRKCSQNCKQGEICTSLSMGDRYACVPEKAGLCQPCSLNIDCPYPGDRCIQLGGTSVCARDCSFDGQCPSSYRCADATDTSGAFVTKQCQPTSGTCECVASTAGQTRPCSETNSIGTCMGQQTCRPPNGYDACSALVPTTESCNAKDDDCNGMTDENLGETTCGTGECRRTISNCVNGAPQQCVPGSGSPEVCNEKDDDCDGQTDEGFDKTTVQNCGACNNACSRPNATSVCDTSGGAAMCRLGACLPGFVNANMMDADGCELMCTPTGPEICDGLDNNCDGRTDEGFNTTSDTMNCGQCGRVCNVNNGNISQYQCIASTCGIMTCGTGFADCDQSYGTGCEKNVSNDINNCGNCNVQCATANGTPTCSNGMCGVGTCNSGFGNCNNMASDGCEVNTNTDVDHCGTCPNACPSRTNATRTCTVGSCGFTCNTGAIDLDGVAANGCEYACTSSGADDPDELFADQNCDGIDGDVSRAIFVAKSGNDLNPGTRAQPKLTVQSGINAANSTRPHVYVSEGTYDEAITLRSGISVYGGYSQASNWARGGFFTVTLRNGVVSSGRIIAVSGTDITVPTTVGYVTIQGRDTVSTGASVYGLHCVRCTALTVRRSMIISGSAGNGATGGAGSTGGGGLIGQPGVWSDCTTNGSGRAGGPGGGSACNRTGGTGGRGGSSGSNAGVTGGIGVVGTAGGAPGGGGDPGRTGQPGDNGFNGATGAGGAGATAVGTVIASFWVGSSGAPGDVGFDGNGGGGGGGGGGQGCFICDDAQGNGGGGGGGGGCGGTGGLGGGPGGGSFAVFLVDSNGLILSGNTISSGNGGTGGVGGQGGDGGPGLGGGLGGQGCTQDVGAGGNGGKGGDGGRGGQGGGGLGGASFGVYRVNSGSVATAGNMLSNGNGGPGGTGGNNGAMGPSGAVF